MKQTMIELLGLKLEDILYEIEKLELQGKLNIVIHEMKSLKHKIMVQELWTKKALQTKEL
jgi:hypothetical protein